jgi:hypothetical protein
LKSTEKAPLGEAKTSLRDDILPGSHRARVLAQDRSDF